MRARGINKNVENAYLYGNTILITALNVAVQIYTNFIQSNVIVVHVVLKQNKGWVKCGKN